MLPELLQQWSKNVPLGSYRVETMNASNVTPNSSPSLIVHGRTTGCSAFRYRSSSEPRSGKMVSEPFSVFTVQPAVANRAMIPSSRNFIN
jgi:hypothetical protein